MHYYELVVVLSPMLNQEQSADTWGRIKEFIAHRDGEITHEEKWGTRRLAYAIRKGAHNFLEGSYHLTRFSAGQPFNRDLENFLRVDEQVLRSLLVNTAPPKPVPDAPAEEVPAGAEPETVGAVATPPVATAVAIPPEAPAAAAPVTVAEAPVGPPESEVAPVAAEETAAPRRRRPSTRRPATEAGAETVAATTEAEPDLAGGQPAVPPRRRSISRPRTAEGAPEATAETAVAPAEPVATDMPGPEVPQA